MNQETLLKELKEITKKKKPNPNNFSIVDKWNYKYIYLSNKEKIFNLILKYFEYQYQKNQKEYFTKLFDNFVDIKDFNLGDKK